MAFRIKKFSLRMLLAAVTVIAVVFGTTIHWYQTGAKQKRDVEKLVLELGGFYEVSPAVSLHQRIHVLYDGDLEWDDANRRFKMTNNFSRSTEWIHDNFGRDFVETPIAIEIECHKFGRSTLPEELVKQIRKLTSVRQVWMADRSGGGKGNEDRLVGPTNDELRTLFPDLIVASPQRIVKR